MRNNYDKTLAIELLNARKRLIEEAENYYSDKWLTGKGLTKLYPCFTTNWLKNYGQYLRRTRVSIWDDNENSYCSSWGYSLNHIEEMMSKGYVQCNGTRFYFNENKTEFTSKMSGFRKW